TPNDADHAQDRYDATHSDRLLADTGATMSDREMRVQAGAGTWDPDTERVKWEEGVKKWIMNERNTWIQWQRALSIPVGAGPSGTTNMLMQAAKVLGADRYDVRAACIAYLLPAHHHTLVE